MKITQSIVIVSLFSFGVAALSSCQTSGKLVKSETSVICPDCQQETKMTFLKGLNYNTHKCPSCKDNWEPGFGDAPMVKVHACDKCGQIVEKCPQCKRQG